MYLSSDVPMTHSGIQRYFVDWGSPMLPRVAELLAERYGADEELALGDVTIIVPGSRAGRRLKELLLLEGERRSAAVVAPRIVTVGGLGQLLLPEEVPLADAVLCRRAWGKALCQAPPAEIHPVIPNPPDGDDLVGWDVLAGVVMKLHRELGGAGRRFRDVEAAFEGGDLFDDGARWRALAGVADRYERILRGVGRVDPELARLWAVRERRIAVAGDVWLVGVVELPDVVREMMEQLGGRVRVAVHAPESEAAAFDDLGCVRPEAWAARPIPLAPSQLLIRDRPGHQAEGVARVLAELGETYALEDVTIAVPDASLVPFLEQRLAADGVPTRYGAGTDVARTAPFRLLRAVAEYLDSESWDSFAALARHPDVSGGSGVPVAALDDYHAAHLPAGVRGEPAGDPSGAGVVVRLRRELDALGKVESGDRSAPLSQWASAIVKLLLRFYGDRPLRRDVAADRRRLAALQRLRDGAAGFFRLPAALDERTNAATAIRLLLGAVEGQEVADEPDRAAIELLGWLEMRLDDAPVAIVTGFNEPHLPQSVNADAFLPDTLRKRLGLVDNARRYARDAYELTALLHSRRHVRLVAGRLDADGNPLRPSRLMLAARGGELAARVLAFAEMGEEVQPAPRVLAAGSIAPGYRLPLEPTIAEPMTRPIRVTDLGRVLQDPYAFALRRIRFLESSGDEAREMDGAVFGDLAHRVLQRFGHHEAAGATDVGLIRRTLRELLDEESRSRFGTGSRPAVLVQVEQLRLRLDAFATWQAERVESGWETVLVEGDLPGAPGNQLGGELMTEFDVDGVRVEVRGRIDRIDRNLGTGEWQVLDYKTSDGAREPEKTHRKGRRPDKYWIDLQLPLYRRMALERIDESGTPLVPPASRAEIRMGYIGISGDPETQLLLADWTAEELEAADAAAIDAIRIIRRGVFEFDPALVDTRQAGDLASVLGLRVVSAVGGEDEGEGEERATR
jgi:ATP-dependent helicase/nuclease subunit B